MEKKPVEEKHIPTIVRLHPTVMRRLKTAARDTGKSQSGIVAELIERFATKVAALRPVRDK